LFFVIIFIKWNFSRKNSPLFIGGDQMKKQMLWTASAIMGLSIFAAPVIGQEKPDSNYSVSAAGKI